MTGSRDPASVPDGADILIRPLCDGQVVVVGRDDGSGEWAPMASAAATTIRAVLGLSRDAPVGHRRFAMAPKSLTALDTDGTVKVGGYFRGTLVDGDGKFTHQVLLKAVNEKGMIVDPLGVANAVQIAALQAQLERMEGLLEHGVAVIEAIKDHLEVQQAAEVNAALGTLRRIYQDTAGRDGVLGEIDWTRLAHLEHALAKGLDAVEQELEYVARTLRFTGEAAKDVKVIKGLTAPRQDPCTDALGAGGRTAPVGLPHGGT